MARSLGRVSPGELDALGSVSDGASGYRYEFGRSLDGSEHVLAETHADHPEHAFGTTVVLGIGSGELDRSYALRYGASLRFAPLEVLPTKEARRAELAPGHMLRSGTRFGTPITNECLACHTDNLPAERFPMDLEPGPEWQPRGISCAACHANTLAHADWQAGEAQTGDPILQHDSLSRSQKLSICAACHLQGDARVKLSADPDAKWKPGDQLLEQLAVFVAEESGPEVGFVSHVSRLSLSACFRSSSMTCGSCHDPHRSLHQAEERARVRSACAQCHGTTAEGDQQGGPECSRTRMQGAGERDCVSCHMPRVGTFDVAHVSIHDHHIRRNIEDAPGPTQPAGLRVLETKNARLRRFSWPWQAPPSDDPGLSMLAYASAKLESVALEYLELAPGPSSMRLPLYHHLRGLLLEASKRPKLAEAAYLRALELDPNLAASSTNLAPLLAASGRPREAFRMLEELLERHPLAEGALRNRALIAAQLGRPELFAMDLEKAFAINPTASLAQTLAKFYGAKGDSQSQARWQSLARDLDPTL